MDRVSTNLKRLLIHLKEGLSEEISAVKLILNFFLLIVVAVGIAGNMILAFFAALLEHDTGTDR